LRFSMGPIVVGMLNQYYDFSWDFQFDPGEPYKLLEGKAVIRIKDYETYKLAEGNVDSNTENENRVISRLTYYVIQRLKTSLSAPSPELRQNLTPTSREIDDLMNVDPDRIQLEEWVTLPDLSLELFSSSEQMEDYMTDKQWDVFISHASEDKEDIAKPLAEALSEKGVKVWYDKFTIKLGDSLRRKIDEGLAQSRYGIVILSYSFFAKEWPQKELDGLAAREYKGEKVILPIWHNVTRDEIMGYSPMLADRYAISTSQGLDVVVDEVLHVIKPVEMNNTVSNLTNAEQYPLEAPNRGDFPRPNLPIEIDSQEIVRFFTYVERALDTRFKTLERAGITVQKTVDTGKMYSYQVRYKNNLIYHFSMRQDDGNNFRISFLDGWTEPIHENASTAFGTIHASLDNPTPMIQITNLSLLKEITRSADLTYEELVESIWAKTCDVIEQRRKQYR
jgi:hypothetical protein